MTTEQQTALLDAVAELLSAVNGIADGVDLEAAYHARSALCRLATIVADVCVEEFKPFVPLGNKVRQRMGDWCAAWRAVSDSPDPDANRPSTETKQSPPTPSHSGERCQTCHWWQPFPYGGGVVDDLRGYCKRSPSLPRRSLGDWCGEWTAASKPATATSPKGDTP